MGRVVNGDRLPRIGEPVGAVGHDHHQSGPISRNRLTREVGPWRDRVLQEVGWLARQGKINLDPRARRRLIQRA